MAEWNYTNPRHDCKVLGSDVIIPKVARKNREGELVLWGFKCPFCSVGRPFNEAEREEYKQELIKEAKDEDNTTESR